MTKSVLIEETAMYRKRCVGCKHQIKLSSGYVICNYIIDANEPRGCDIEVCDKYEKGSTRKPLPDEQLVVANARNGFYWRNY